jgi:SAM-dependent methyltransferase
MIARATPAVVDLGTGSGTLAERILDVRPRARLIGIDADPAMLATATRRLRGRIETIEDNFERTRIPPVMWCRPRSPCITLRPVAAKPRSTSAASRRSVRRHVGQRRLLPRIEHDRPEAAIAKRGSTTCSVPYTRARADGS